IVIGTGIVFCAQASQLYICTSVPQIDVLKTRISTSSPFTSGTGTVSSHKPGSAFAFTTACIVFCTKSEYPQISQIHADYKKQFVDLICVICGQISVCSGRLEFHARNTGKCW